MRKLLNTLYVTSADSYLSLDGENIVILRDEAEKIRVPLHNIEGIVTFGYTGASPALMEACAKRLISLAFMTANGRFMARVTGETQGNVLLRRQQYRMADMEEVSADIARNILVGKIFNSKWVLQRAMRDHALRVDVERLRSASDNLREGLDVLQECEDLEQLRGVEGKAASVYFQVLDELIVQQKDEFYFETRSRRPPLDNVNAMLSFVYTLLTNDAASALSTVGLDPYVGFLHRDRPGRISLALDMIEELRSVFADRFVLTSINCKIINGKGFHKHENGAVTMDDETRRALINAWQERKKEIIRHPFLNEKIPWGLVPFVQAMLLARFIRGDLDEYPPFMWK